MKRNSWNRIWTRISRMPAKVTAKVPGLPNQTNSPVRTVGNDESAEGGSISNDI